MPSFTPQPVVDQTKLGNKDTDLESNGRVCPDAPKLANAMPVPVTSSPLIPDSLLEVQDPAAGLTSIDLAHPYPGITGVTASTSTKVTVQLPLLTLIDPSSTIVLQRALLAAHLCTHHVLLLPCANGDIHLAANYPSAGHLALDTALAGPATPFTTTRLHPNDLQHLRRFTLLVPTHKEWKGDALIKREQLVEFLFSDDVLGPDHDAENDPRAVEHRWFEKQARKHAARRAEWTGAVRRCIRTLAGGLMKSLHADGEVGEDARRRVEGDIVFQQWFDGWGQKCGADCTMVVEVDNTIDEMERSHGRALWDRLKVAEGTEEGAWAVVEEGEVGAEGEEEENVWEVGEMEATAAMAEMEA
ncbi:hypothetical protein UCDDS831_g09277 [Diplodia seriata]|uniref:Uncharacterized protein n=1 Tax=Diplodia seriata TaxID=420778 RepID=A0A0G2DQ36_9PEZI|nr:hypothetical protein UCDDS831_g09277 [Diplodia seriata]